MGGKSMRVARTFFLFSLCLLLTAAFSGCLDFAAAQQIAQQQEKRIALVVGNGAYAKTPLATTANDAGLIAQTLQAAGFDVIGARDLDADSLRKTFRDFMQKIQASPSDTVAMVYLSGYGVQLAGENYFIPVDSTINRDTDIPIEGLRISDYTRELGSVPLKASVVVLDAARQQPFIEGGNPIASGLALVDPSPNTLIAFNAAPGTVAPGEPGPYGAYAQALAEMIRTGGLPLPDVFDRVRLRVSENTKGGQIPWDAQKIQVPFTFFDRAADAPPVQGTPDQVAAIRERPMRDLGAQEAFNAALARDTMQGYEDFLAAYGSDPLAKRVRAILAARRESITWRRTYLADTPDAYWSYLRRYPRGPHTWDCRRRLTILSAALEPPPSFAMIDYDLPPPPPDEMMFVDRPVFYFGDPVFAFAPPPPPPVFFLPPPPPDFVVLAPPIVAVGVGIGVGLFVLPRPAFVPMPAFVRPPVYVAAPPNNIIFNNIHNTTVINTVINNPAPTPAAIAAAGGPRTGTLGPTLPNNVAQRASLIQEGKLQPPPSASISATARPGTPGVTPANVAPNATLRQELPRANALPVPGTKGAPPPPGTSGRPGTTPSAGLTTPTEVGKPNLREERLAPTTSGKPTTTQPATTTLARPEPNAARPAPPSPPKPAAPKQEAKRAMPPPPPPKPAAAPPPPRPATAAVRPAPPPPAAKPPPPAAAKKCPPNQPRC
jgi:uncharacterized caspase-like protein